MQRKLEQLGERALQQLRCIWRRRQNLLVLRLAEQKLFVEYWQAQSVTWQECLDLADSTSLLPQGEENLLAAAEEALRALLLTKEVEENVQTLLVPAEFMLRYEELSMPVLGAWELRQAVSWEAANAFPWAEGGYAYAYLNVVQAGDAERTSTLHLWGMELELLKKLEKLGANLLLKLEVVTSLDVEKIGAAWYKGEGLAYFKAHRQALVPQAKLRRLLARTAGAVLVLSLACYAGAWGGFYLAQEGLTAAQSELVSLKEWQARQHASELAERKIARLEKLRTQVQAAPEQRVSVQVEQLGRLLGAECWLTQFTQEGRSVQLQGKALHQQALASFIESLQQTKSYTSVELRQAQAQGALVEYILQLERTEGKQ